MTKSDISAYLVEISDGSSRNAGGTREIRAESFAAALAEAADWVAAGNYSQGQPGERVHYTVTDLAYGIERAAVYVLTADDCDSGQRKAPADLPAPAQKGT
jgi:hypothetical protein